MFSFFKRRKVDPKQSLIKVLGGAELPSFSSVILRAMDSLRNPDNSVNDAADIISNDPGLSVRVLKVVNSAAFGLGRPIASVNQAINLLGRAQVESMLLAVAARSALPSPSAGGFDATRFWRTSARRAASAGALAEVLHPARKAECFTASLLQDMAMPMLLSARGADYGPLIEHWRHSSDELTSLERSEFGWDHAEVATWLCDTWEFPEPMAASIGDHHGTGGDGMAAPPAVRLVALLDEVDEEGGRDRVVATAAEDYNMLPDTVTQILDDSFEAAEEIARLYA